MSDSEAVIPDSEASWGDDFHRLATEYDLPYSVEYEKCSSADLYQWKAILKICRRSFVGFGHKKQEAKERAMQNGFPWLRLMSEPEARRRSRSAQYGAIRAERGFQNESAVLRALSDPSFVRPVWLRSVRRATSEEDLRKIDVVVTTDVGPLYLQVKSSQVFAIRFEERRRSTLIGVIVASYDEDPRVINDRAMQKLRELRNTVLSRRLG